MAKRDLEQERRHQAREDHRRAIGERKSFPAFAKKGVTAVEEGRLHNGLTGPVPTIMDRNLVKAQEQVALINNSASADTDTPQEQ